LLNWRLPAVLDEFSALLEVRGDALLDRAIAIMISLGMGQHHANVGTHWTQIFYEAQLVHEGTFNDPLSRRVDSATVVRGAHNLLRHFDVEVLKINIQRRLPVDYEHRSLITNMIVLASYAHCNYRKQLKLCAFKAGLLSSPSGIQQAATIRDSTANSCLTKMCKSNLFRNFVLDERNGNPHGYQYANDIMGTNIGYAQDAFNFDRGVPLFGVTVEHSRTIPGLN